MNISDYLKKTLSQYPVSRIKCHADIELQNLVDDKVIYVGDCYYLRNENLERIGVVCEYSDSKNAAVESVKIKCQPQ